MTPAHETSSHGIPHVYWSVVRTFAQHTDVANLLWDAFGVAVNAFDGMDIVRALGRFESRIHGFDIQAAIRELWMAGGARRTSVLSVSLVAGEATEPFVNSHGGAIISRADLSAGQSCVALIAECLADIRADLHCPIAQSHGWQRELCQRHIVQFSPIK